MHLLAGGGNTSFFTPALFTGGCSQREKGAALSQLVEAASVEDAKKVLATAVTPYWETHYTFGSTSVRNDRVRI